MVVGALPTASLTSCDSEPSEADVVHDHIRLRQYEIVAIACIGVRLARHVKHPGTTERGETMSGSSCGGQLSAGGGSTKMISDGRSYANRKVLVQCVCEHLLPTAQARWLRRPGPLVAAPRAGDRHIDLFRYLIPGQALIAQLNDLLGGGGMGGRSARTHGDAGTLELLADRAPVNAQLGTDLAQGPTLSVQVGRSPNVHRDTVTSLSRIGATKPIPYGGM